MSGGRPASVDGPLLARKGDAVPAIPDQSPLGFQLDHDQAELHSRPREQDGKKKRISRHYTACEKQVAPCVSEKWEEILSDALDSSYRRGIIRGRRHMAFHRF